MARLNGVWWLGVRQRDLTIYGHAATTVVIIFISLFFQTARRQLESVIPRLNKIAELQDELRECVSPTDIKMANQKLWVLRQRQDDLDHRLEARAREITAGPHLDRLNGFKERCQRFVDWADGLERRLSNNKKNGQMVSISQAPCLLWECRKKLPFSL